MEPEQQPIDARPIEDDAVRLRSLNARDTALVLDVLAERWRALRDELAESECDVWLSHLEHFALEDDADADTVPIESTLGTMRVLAKLFEPHPAYVSAAEVRRE